MIFKGSIEDFIYIIIGIIWLVFSIYKGSQKKKKAGKPAAEPQPAKKESSSIFDNFLENLMKEEEEQGVPYEQVEIKKDNKPPSVAEPNEMESEKVFSYDDMAVENSFDYDVESNYLKPDQVYDKPSAQPETKLQEELRTHLKPTKKKPRFDLRKAVIYSEILNRRYF
ncbi:MAG: hypothetical protein P8100_16025 [bacterium]